MAFLNFKYGAQAGLSSQAFAAGTVYITNDTKKLYVDNPEGTSGRICLGDFQLVEYSSGTALSALQAYSLKETNILYITLDTSSGATKGDTALYRYNGTDFVAISNTAEIDTIKNDIEALQSAVNTLNTFKDTTVPNTYMPIAGGKNFTGDVGFVSGKYLTVNTPRAGESGKNDAVPRQYADDIKSTLLGSSSATTTTNATIYDVKRAAAKAQETADNATTDAANAQATADNAVPKAGGTMTGALILNADPTSTSNAKQAATKNYVDTAKASAISTAAQDATNKANAVLGDSADTSADKTVYGAHAAAAAALSAANNAATNAMPKAGGEFSGDVTFAADATLVVNAPTAGSNEAATAKYVDDAKASAISTAANDATTKANAVLGQSTDGATANTVYGAKAAAAAAQSTASNAMPKSGGTFSGNVVMGSGKTLTVNTPSESGHAATKGYVDAAESNAVNTAKDYTDARETAILGTQNGSNFVGTVQGAYAAAEAAASAASGARDVADKAMPKAGGEFSGNVTFASGKTLTVNAPTAGSNQAATAKYVDEAKASAISTVQGTSSDTKDSATIAGAKKYTDAGIQAVNSEITTLKNNIGNLSNIMNFLGTTTSDVKQDATITSISVGGSTVTAVKGDVVIKGAKEFVFDGSKWQEIGDVSAQSTAIDGLLERMSTAEDEINVLQDDLGASGAAAGTDSAFARIKALEDWKGNHSTDYDNLEGRMDDAESAIEGLVGTVGTRPSTPAMDTTLWEEVADLRLDLGESNASAGTSSAFARIKKAETAIGTTGDSASASGSLYARIAKNAGDIGNIGTTIGSPSDAASATGSLYARITENYETNNKILEVLKWGAF